MSTSPRSSASVDQVVASSDEAASGFSTKTCLPASSARIARARSGSRRASRSRPHRASRRAAALRSASCTRPPGSGGRCGSSALWRAGRRLRELGGSGVGEVAGEVRAPVAEPDDADANGSPSPRSSGASAVSRRRSSGERRPAEQAQVETERPAAGVGDVEVERLAERRVRAGRHLPEPVMPGGHRNRSKWCGAKNSVSYGRHGRGPTSDMSPRRTLTAAAARRGSSSAASGRTA